MLVWVLIKEVLDAPLLVRVNNVVNNVTLNTSEHLAKLTRDPLLAGLDDSGHVGVSACILIGQLVSVLVPQLLGSLRNECILLGPTEPRVWVDLAALSHLCLLQVV